jgi:hypothetical protein
VDSERRAQARRAEPLDFPAIERVLRARGRVLGDAKRSLGDAKSSLGDAKSWVTYTPHPRPPSSAAAAAAATAAAAAIYSHPPVRPCCVRACTAPHRGTAESSRVCSAHAHTRTMSCSDQELAGRRCALYANESPQQSVGEHPLTQTNISAESPNHTTTLSSCAGQRACPHARLGIPEMGSRADSGIPPAA